MPHFRFSLLKLLRSMKSNSRKKPGMRMVMRQQTTLKTALRQRVIVSSCIFSMVALAAFIYFNFTNKPKAAALPPDLIYGVGNGDGYAFSSFSTTTPLPIELLSFTANCNNGKVIINWSTASEKNNDFFTIERSQNGKNFNPLIKVPGAGNSSTINTYQIVDDNPIANVNYYRLKQTDYDGKFTYAPIKSASCDNHRSEEELKVESIGPNPFTENFTLNYTTINEGAVNIRILNAAGGIIKQEIVSAEKGFNTYFFNDNMNMAPGIYYVTIAHEGKVVTKKIIKQ